jgi:hypothetical protein
MFLRVISESEERANANRTQNVVTALCAEIGQKQALNGINEGDPLAGKQSFMPDLSLLWLIRSAPQQVASLLIGVGNFVR